MATLQTIRSKGPLLVIVIGLALFAFIAGDAWKILQPHQGKQDAGEVNGNTLSAQDYQKMVKDPIRPYRKFPLYFYYLREKQGFLDEDGPRGKQDTAFQSENWRAFLSSCLSTPPHISFLS